MTLNLLPGDEELTHEYDDELISDALNIDVVEACVGAAVSSQRNFNSIMIPAVNGKMNYFIENIVDMVISEAYPIK